MATGAMIRANTHRGIGAVLAIKGALALGGVGPGAVELGPLTFDNVEARMEQAAQGHSTGQTQSQGTSDLLIGGALAALRPGKKEPPWSGTLR